MDPFEQRIRQLESFGHRGSASAHEHRAAEYLCDELRKLGLQPIQEPFRGARSLGARLMAHVLVAAAGAALLWIAPVATVVLATIATISLVAEQSTRSIWLSRPVVRFASFNVWGRIPPAGPIRKRLILCAHYDTQPSGWVWIINRYLAPLGWRSPLLLKPPMLPVMMIFLAEIGIGAAAIAIGHPISISVVGVLLLIAYAVLSVLMLQWANGTPVPGAADNASGVAAVLELAERWIDHPQDGVELIVLFPGCEESGMLGAAAWGDRHADELRRAGTVFLNIDGIGFGPPRFLGVEVPLVGLPIHGPRDVLEECARAAAHLNLSDAGPHALPTTDGLAFLARGIAGVTIVGFRAGGVLPHYHTFQDITDNLDFNSARKAVEFAWAVVCRLGS